MNTEVHLLIVRNNCNGIGTAAAQGRGGEVPAITEPLSNLQDPFGSVRIDGAIEFAVLVALGIHDK